MGLLTRFWSRDRFARTTATELLGADWLVTPGTLEPIASRLLEQAEQTSKASIRSFYEKHSAERKALAASGRRAQEASDSLVVRDGVAVIGLSGLMMKEVPSGFSLFEEPAVSTNYVRLQLAAANQRQDVRSILLIIDSPGGMVNGTEALANDVATSPKPVHAYAADLAASAALWVASSAARFTVGRTASIGSIGVYTVIDDTSKLFEEAGIKSTLISSGGVKGALEAGIQISDEAKADVQRRIDALADLFIESVATGRNMSAADVRKLATGQTWHGAEAVARGLADAVETDDQAFEAARGAAGNQPTTPAATTKIVVADRISPALAAGNKERSNMKIADVLAKVEKGDKLTEAEHKLLREKTGETKASDPVAASPATTDFAAELAAEKAAREKLEKKLADVEAKQKKDAYLVEADTFKYVAGLSREEIAEELEAADARGESAGKRVRKHFATTDKVMRESHAFDVLGSSQSGEQSPMAQLQAHARKLRAADPKLSELEALALAGEQHKDLYAAARGEQD